MKKLLLAAVLAVTLGACKRDKTEVVRSFCYWKTSFNYDNNDSLISSVKATHLYVRYFDVGWNPYTEEALPIATMNDFRMYRENPEITPCVFITNDVLLNAGKPQLDLLAERISQRISKITEAYVNQRAGWEADAIAEKDYKSQDGQQVMKRINADSLAKTLVKNYYSKFSDVLIDCDWSEKSKGNYFYLLTKLKQQLKNTQLEATIRLWQYKYFEKAGIPPVDKGLLMCYNMNNPGDYNVENSIGSAKELSQYLTHSDYKLPLDVALPLFSWAVAFSGDRYKGIVSNYDMLEQDTINFSRKGNRYVLRNDMLIGDKYMRNGDEIRVEKVPDAELRKMAEIINDRVSLKGKTRITFFSLDTKIIQDYGIKNIDAYYSLF